MGTLSRFGALAYVMCFAACVLSREGSPEDSAFTSSGAGAGAAASSQSSQSSPSSASAGGASSSASTGGGPMCAGDCVDPVAGAWSTGKAYSTPGNCANEQIVYACEAPQCTCGAAPGSCAQYESKYWKFSKTCTGAQPVDIVHNASDSVCFPSYDSSQDSYEYIPLLTNPGSCGPTGLGTAPLYFCAGDAAGCMQGQSCEPKGGRECVLATMAGGASCPAGYDVQRAATPNSGSSCCGCTKQEGCAATMGTAYQTNCGNPISFAADGMCHVASPTLGGFVSPAAEPSTVACTPGLAPQDASFLVLCCK